MTATPRLSLPYIASGQAQKHVTHNDALIRLDALIHLMVASRTQALPPAVPAETEAYLVPADGEGVFAGRMDQLALFEDGGWIFLEPRKGWQCWIEDEAELHVWTGSQWRRASPLSEFGASLWGVNATADETARLAVSSEASLFNHAGAGHQIKLNKAAAGDTAGLLFQDAFSGRAELGLAGDDDFHFKVSADGSSWTEAMVIEAASGIVRLPASPWAAGTSLLVNGDMQVNQRGFAGGALAAGDYGFDRWKADTGGANLSLSGFDVTLASGAIVQLVEPELWGLGSLASVPLCLSVDGLSGGSLSVQIGSQSGSIAPGAGRRSLTLTPAAGDVGAIGVRLAPVSGPVSFKRVKLELGSAQTGWSPRPLSAEQMLCRRYYWMCLGSLMLDAYQAAAAASRQQIRLPVPMRASPAVSFSVSQEINIQGSDRGISVQSPESAYAYVTAQALGRVRAAFGDVAFDAELP